MDFFRKTVLIFILIQIISADKLNLLKSGSIDFVKPNSCMETEYYDTVWLTCRQCVSESRAADSGVALQRGSPDRLSCVCAPHHKFVKSDKPGVKCQPCQDDEVTSFDGWNCVKCPENYTKNETEVCLPCQNGIIVEKYEDSILKQECVECPGSTWPDTKSNRCVHCPLDFQLAAGNCSCPLDKYVISGGSCIPLLNLLPPLGAWSTLNFENGLKINSAYFQEHLQAAIYNCQVIRNASACQVLANLCVLTNYKLNSDKSDSTACDKYLEIVSNAAVKGPENMPWLFYSDETAQETLTKTNVKNIFAFNSGKNMSRFNLAAATYSLNGSFLGIFPITPSKLGPCHVISDEIETGFLFGVQYQRECQLKVRNIWDGANLVFYELFLIHNSPSGQMIYPIPVLNKNLNKNGKFINRDSDKSKWQLTRRFYLRDAVSGVEFDQENGAAARVFRYASHVSIKITVRDDENNVGSIYPPLLTLEFEEVTSDDFKLNAQVNSYFSVSYEMEQSRTFSNISISLGIISTLSLIWTVFQTWGWCRRSGKHRLDIMTIGRFLIHACGTLANAFFLVILCASINWLIMFKCQSVVHLLLPTQDQSESLMIYVIIALAMKCVQLLDILVTQCTVNIFFIDWERPNGKSKSGGLTSNNRRTSVKMTDETSMAPETSSSITGSLLGGRGAITRNSLAEKYQEMSAATIWRVYFVASTWTELQTLRRVAPSIQLFCTLLFLNVIGFENLSKSDPFSKLSHDDEWRLGTSDNQISRLAIGASIYLAVVFLQLTIHKVIYERFFEDKLQQFVDLCSVSNVSVFAMTAIKYGYYIHGRSTHGRADINMKEMHEHLRREEEDLCGQRGLLPNTEQQTFRMALPEGVHEQYQRLLLPLRSYSQTSDRMQGAGGRLSRVDIDRVVNTYLMMNKFLSGFIEHAFKDLDYVVRDRLLLENILDLEFARVTDRGIFYNDNGNSFDWALFCGQESTLIIFEVLLFCVIDSTSKNFVFAAILTYFTSKAIEAVRKSVGRRNLVRKALIDERFLS